MPYTHQGITPMKKVGKEKMRKSRKQREVPEGKKEEHKGEKLRGLERKP